jgi:NADPH:quinone reductase-like Zn-dependent oxidoreductase
MKSWFVWTEGGHMEVGLREVPVPQPKAGEILLRVHATSMNRGEFIAGHGLVAPGEARPGGTEAAGTVEAIGSGVTGMRAGDRIMGRVRGGFSEHAIIDAQQAIPVPAKLTWEEAACAPLVYLTAYDLLYTYGRLAAGEWLLVTGISSGVGVACLQIAKAIVGAKVIGTSGSAGKLAKLERYGLDAGVVTRTQFAEAVKQKTGGGANLAVNCVGGSVFAEILRALAYHGRVGIVGYVVGVVKAEIDLDAVHARRLQVYGVSNKNATREMRAAQVQGFVRDVVPAFADGRIAPIVDRVFALDELPAAKAYMESNAALGKIVVRVA